MLGIIKTQTTFENIMTVIVHMMGSQKGIIFWRIDHWLIILFFNSPYFSLFSWKNVSTSSIMGNLIHLHMCRFTLQNKLKLNKNLSNAKKSSFNPPLIPAIWFWLWNESFCDNLKILLMRHLFVKGCLSYLISHSLNIIYLVPSLCVILDHVDFVAKLKVPSSLLEPSRVIQSHPETSKVIQSRSL